MGKRRAGDIQEYDCKRKDCWCEQIKFASGCIKGEGCLLEH